MTVIKKILNVFSGATDKTTPVDGDYVELYNSVTPKEPNKLSWANIKATLKTYFDALYLTLSGGALSGALNEAKGTDIASATTTDIGAATGNYVVVTGTITITGLGTVQAGTRREVTFSGILILTYNATSLILPTGANITTAAGDTAIFISLGSGNWVCTSYQRKDGTALAATVTLTGTETLTNKTLIDTKFKTTINAQTNTTYTLILTDNSKLITFDNASPIAVTIPTNASVAFPIGTQIDCVQILAGKVTFSGSGVTINSKGGNKSIATQWVGVSLIKTNTDTWLLLGELIA